MPTLPFENELFELLTIEFYNSIIILCLIGLMLYTNAKYEKNFILQAFWLIANSWYFVSLIDDMFIIFPLIMVIFNTIVNVIYINFGMKRK